MIQLIIQIQAPDLNTKYAPSRESVDAAGYDLRACIEKPFELSPGEKHMFSCGFSMALPRGYEAQIRPRSGLANKHGVTVLNAPGTIDADYRGVVGVILINHGKTPFIVEPGDRIAQMVLAQVQTPNVVILDRLEETKRGSGGFGSSGVK